MGVGVEIDISIVNGRLFFVVFVVLVEYEVELILEWIRVGL